MTRDSVYFDFNEINVTSSCLGWSHTFRKGEITGLVGGKTYISSFTSQIVNPSNALKVDLFLIDGERKKIDANSLSPEIWLRSVSCITSECTMIEGTILENILLFPMVFEAVAMEYMHENSPYMQKLSRYGILQALELVEPSGLLSEVRRCGIGELGSSQLPLKMVLILLGRCIIHDVTLIIIDEDRLDLSESIDRKIYSSLLERLLNHKIIIVFGDKSIEDRSRNYSWHVVNLGAQ